MRHHSGSYKHNIAPPSVLLAAITLVNRPMEKTLLIRCVLATSLHDLFSFLEVSMLKVILKTVSAITDLLFNKYGQDSLAGLILGMGA